MLALLTGRCVGVTSVGDLCWDVEWVILNISPSCDQLRNYKDAINTKCRTDSMRNGYYFSVKPRIIWWSFCISSFYQLMFCHSWRSNLINLVYCVKLKVVVTFFSITWLHLTSQSAWLYSRLPPRSGGRACAGTWRSNWKKCIAHHYWKYIYVLLFRIDSIENEVAANICHKHVATMYILFKI